MFSELKRLVQWHREKQCVFDWMTLREQFHSYLPQALFFTLEGGIVANHVLQQNNTIPAPCGTSGNKTYNRFVSVSNRSMYLTLHKYIDRFETEAKWLQVSFPEVPQGTGMVSFCCNAWLATIPPSSVKNNACER